MTEAGGNGQASPGTKTSQANDPKSWHCKQEKTLIDSPVLQVIQRDCQSSEDGREHRFYLLKSRDWCNIIPITEDGKVVMVRQYRIGISQHTLECPGGIADPTDANVQAAAVREMEEETGYSPLPGSRVVSLGWMYPNPAIQDNRCHTFVVGPVRKKGEQHLDEGEMIDVIEVPLEEIPDRILRGEINHALILNAFLFLSLREGGSSGLRDALSLFTRV